MEFGLIQPESPRYCDEFTTVCRNLFGSTAIKLVYAECMHEPTEYKLRHVGSNYRLGGGGGTHYRLGGGGGHTLQIGGTHYRLGTHIIFFFFFNLLLLFFFFLGGGGAYLCKLLGGGGHAPPPRAPPPIPTALNRYSLPFLTIRGIFSHDTICACGASVAK